MRSVQEQRADRAPWPTGPEMEGVVPVGQPQSYEAVARERDHYRDLLMSICGHLEIPFSTNGPCDHIREYEKVIDGIESYGADQAVRADHWLAEYRRVAARFSTLRNAVRALHDAAFWRADRPCDAHGLWKAVRDAAEIAPPDAASAVRSAQGRPR